MTREERLAKLAELRAEVEDQVKEYNAIVAEGKFDDAAKVDSAISERVNEYTAIARDLTFEDCKATEDPMMEAIKRLTFRAITIKDEKKDEGRVSVRSIVDREKPIDLMKLHNHCGRIGAEADWYHIAQKMNFLLTAQTAHNLGANLQDINSSYAMSEIAAQFDMGENPTSKTNLLRTLQRVVSAMIGEGYKATSHDVNYLLAVYAKKGRKALSVSCANHRYFRNYMAEICHRIVMGESYGVEFKAKKNA